jgi:hypothetical protein
MANDLVAASPSFTIVGDLDKSGGQLGWAAFRVDDINHDGIDDMLISAVFANMVYLIYGRKTFPETVQLHELNTQQVCKIVGSSFDRYFGITLALVHDFNNDGSKEIAISAMRSNDGRGIVYILFGSVGFANGGEIDLDQLLASNSPHILKIIGPMKTYTGFSIAGIGDINRDDYDDLALGTVPHASGEQITYIIYGRKELYPNNELQLSSFTEENGFIVKGAGFLVQAAGDVNYDGIPDVMVTQLSEWSSHGHAYLIDFPENVTYSPTLQPTSMPSITQTTHIPYPSPVSRPSSRPTANGSSTVPLFPMPMNSSSPSIVNTVHPSTSVPSPIPSLTPSSPPTSSRPSCIPSEKPTILKNAKTLSPTTRSPFVASTNVPTSSYSLRTNRPSISPTAQSTINTTTFTTTDCSSFGRYEGNNETNNRFIVTTLNGTVELKGNEEGNAINIYSLHCSGNILDVVIMNFRSSTDRLDLSELSAFYTYHSFSDITYSFHRDSLIMFFCYDSLHVKLTNHQEFDLQEGNFIFDKSNHRKDEKPDYTTEIQTGVFVGLIFFIITGYVLLDGLYGNEKKLDTGEKWKEDQRSDKQQDLEGDIEEDDDFGDMSSDSGLSSPLASVPVSSSSSHMSNFSLYGSYQFTESDPETVSHLYGSGSLLSEDEEDEEDEDDEDDISSSQSSSWMNVLRSEESSSVDKDEPLEEEELSSLLSGSSYESDDEPNERLLNYDNATRPSSSSSPVSPVLDER